MSADLVDRICDLLGIRANDEQRAVIGSAPGPAVVIAGAGSGKTTVMAARVLHLVGTGVARPGEVLGLTFTNKAAGEFLARVRDNLALAARTWGGPFAVTNDDTDPTISTYHAFAQRLLVDHGLRIGAEPDALLLSEGALRRIAYRTVVTTRSRIEHVTLRPVDLASALIDLDKAMVEQCIDTEVLMDADQRLIDTLPTLRNSGQAITREILATSRTRQELVRLVAEFRAAKAEAGGRDFTDQMRLVHELSVRRPEVGVALREAHRVVLLDEYQDTSIAQRAFLQGFFGDGHPVTAVGDPFQAIYGWRGASVHNITAFAHHFALLDANGTRRPAVVHDLSVNYRSTARILEGANAVALELRAEHPDVPSLRAGADRGPGRWWLSLHETRREEAAWAAARAHELWQGILAEEAAGTRAVPEGKERGQRVAVLCRDGAGMRSIAVELDRIGAPYEVVGVEGLLIQPVVADVLAHLSVIHDPTANSALVRLLTGPRWTIGPRDLALLGRRAYALTDTARSRAETTDPAVALDAASSGHDPADVVALVDALDDPGDQPYSPQARERFAELSRLLRSLRAHAGDPVEDLIARVLRVTGLEVEMRLGDPTVAERSQAAVAQLIDLAGEAAVHAGLRSGARADGHGLGAFLAWVHDLRRFGGDPQAERPGISDAIRLMTVHAAKGLEFTAVVLPFLVEKVFPTGQSRPRWYSSASVVHPWLTGEPMTPPIASFPDMVEGPRAKDVAAFSEEWTRLDLLEERRLAYVAVTRAREFLVASGHVWGPTQVRPYVPADYLLRLRDLALPGETGPWMQAPLLDAGNPELALTSGPVAWPRHRDEEARQRRLAGAALVEQALHEVGSAGGDDTGSLSDGEADLLASWDADLEVVERDLEAQDDAPRLVRLPQGLTTSALMDLAADPEAFAERLARPMPRPASVSADRGTAFHAWVESRWAAQIAAFTDEEMQGAADDDLLDRDLQGLKAAFEAGPFADERPAAVEVPFAVVLGGRPVRGRIDAVFARGDRWLVVDWKTSQRDVADPVQLAVYRLAWAERQGCDPADVDAAFHFVRSGTTQEHPDLPGREHLERLLA